MLLGYKSGFNGEGGLITGYVVESVQEKLLYS